MFDYAPGLVTPEEIENLRRSVAMLPPDYTGAPLGRAQVEQLVAEVSELQRENQRYRSIIWELRRVLGALDEV